METFNKNHVSNVQIKVSEFFFMSSQQTS